MKDLCPMPGCRVERVAPDTPNHLYVAAHGMRPGGPCPDCGRASRAVHSRYRRRPADLPSLGCVVRVGLRVRRFYCRNAACARRTFAERLPELVTPYARRTRRLAEAQGRVGAALGGEGAARLLAHLSMPASADTVLRLIRDLPLPGPEAPRVADRWHLLANMRQAVERWLHGAHARIRRLPPVLAGPGASPARRDRAFPRSAPERAASAESRARWQARYDEVRRRHLAGETLLGIARNTGLALGTVRKYARAESFPARTAPGPGPSILDPYLPHLEQRLIESCENALALWRELRGLGFPGGARQVHRWLSERRTAPARTGPHVRRTQKVADVLRPAARDMAGPLPMPTQLAWLLVQPASALDANEAASVSYVEQDGEAKLIMGLARRFTALVRAGGLRRQPKLQHPVADLDNWLAEARACGTPAIATFATGLETDGVAVRAALTQPWSSGQAEGQITRLKLIKRQMYGRASFDLLRRRVLLAA